MSLFDGLDNIVNNMYSQVEADMMSQVAVLLKEAQINQKRPSITSLPFAPVPVKNVENIKKTNTGFFGLKLFGGGKKDQFVASVESGRTTYAKVLVLAGNRRVVNEPDDPVNNVYKSFYKLADLNGTVIREDVPEIDDEYNLALPYNVGNSEGATGSADVVDPKAYLHAIVVHYYLKDEQFYVLLTKEQFDDMTALGNNLGNYWHFAEDGVGYKW